MTNEEKVCPKCGKPMSLVAAGWYCTQDDFLIDRVTGKPVVEPEYLLERPTEERVERLKRPLGLTVISILWLLGGIFNLYTSSQVIGTDLEALPFLSFPTVPEWVRFALPIDLAIGVLSFFLGLVQLFTIYGLWTGKSWSYKLALAIPILIVFTWISAVGLYASAPAEYGLLTSVEWGGLLASVFYASVYWVYLRKRHVKEYLGIRSIKEQRPSSPI